MTLTYFWNTKFQLKLSKKSNKVSEIFTFTKIPRVLLKFIQSSSQKNACGLLTFNPILHGNVKPVNKGRKHLNFSFILKLTVI